MAETFTYAEGGVEFEGKMVRPDNVSGDLPLVLFAPAWAGLTEGALSQMEKVADLGYLVAGLDLYGRGRLGSESGDNGHLIGPLMADRALLRRRLLAGFEAAKALPGAQEGRTAVIGYCFGGLCAIDLARANPDGLRAAVSFHGLLKPTGLEPGPITAAILVAHGWDDPMAPPADVEALGRELTEAGGDWQIHAYGHTLHGFTQKRANAPERGVAYNAAADRRSWAAMCVLLSETLGA